MKYIKHIRRGILHKTFCEDFLIDEIINDKYRILGVFDGCSSGIDSHFASALFGKTVITVAKKLHQKSKEITLKNIIYKTIKSLKNTKKKLNLDTNELLSTMILMLVDTEIKTVDIIAIGDGYLSINDQITNIDQKNQPDYLAYHFDKISNKVEFEIFYNKQLIFNKIKVKDITISTDGIDTFQNSSSEINEIEYLTKDLFLKDNIAMLSRKCNILKKRYNLENTDDLAIIRVFNQ